MIRSQTIGQILHIMCGQKTLFGLLDTDSVCEVSLHTDISLTKPLLCGDQNLDATTE